MERARIFRMTIASYWYDDSSKVVREHEAHFRVARRGNIRRIRRRLADIGLQFLRRTVRQRFQQFLPRDKIRVSFEREEPALAPQNQITVDVRRMEGVGKRWQAFPEPSVTIPYVRRRRRHRRHA